MYSNALPVQYIKSTYYNVTSQNKLTWKPRARIVVAVRDSFDPRGGMRPKSLTPVLQNFYKKLMGATLLWYKKTHGVLAATPVDGTKNSWGRYRHSWHTYFYKKLMG